MKKILFFLAFLIAAESAPSLVVTNNFSASGTPPLGLTGRIQISFAPTQTPWVDSNGTIYFSSNVTAVITNGFLTNTYIAPGQYNVTVGPLSDYALASIPATTNMNAVPLWPYLTNINTFSNLAFIPGVTAITAGSGISVSSSGSVYSVSATGGLATNVPTLTAGANVTITTNGNPTITNYVIASTSSGGSSVFVTNVPGNSSGLSAATNGSAVTVTSTNNQFLSSLTGALGTSAFQPSTAFQPTSQNLSNFSVLATNAFYPTNANLQAGSLLLSNITSPPLTNAAAFQPATTILSNITSAPLTNATQFIAATNGVAIGQLTFTNSPWNHLETNWGWLDTSNGVLMDYSSNGNFYSVSVVSANATLTGAFTGNGAGLTNLNGYYKSVTNVGLSDFRLDFPFNDAYQGSPTPPWLWNTFATFGSQPSGISNTNGGEQNFIQTNVFAVAVANNALNMGFNTFGIWQIFTNQDAYGVQMINSNRFTNLSYCINLVHSNGYKAWAFSEIMFTDAGTTNTDCGLDTGGDPGLCLDGYANPWEVLRSNAFMICSNGFDGIEFSSIDSSGSNTVLAWNYAQCYAYWLRQYSETNGRPMNICLCGFSGTPNNAYFPSAANYLNGLRPNYGIGVPDGNGSFASFLQNFTNAVAANTFPSPGHYLEWYTADVYGCFSGKINEAQTSLAGVAMTCSQFDIGTPWAFRGDTCYGVDPRTLITNAVFKSIANDPAMIPCACVSNLTSANILTYAKPIGGYSSNLAVLFLNPTGTTNTVTISLTNFNISLAPATIYDIWNGTNFGTLSNSTTLTISVLPTNSIWVKIATIPPPITNVPYSAIVFSGVNNANLTFGSNAAPTVSGNVSLIAMGNNAANQAFNPATTTAVGNSALFWVTTQAGNSAFGYLAIGNTTPGNQNSAFGVQADTAAAGSQDSCFGFQSLENCTGNLNSALGYQAGINLTSGSNNLYLNNAGNSGDIGQAYIGTTGLQTNITFAGVMNGNGSGLTNLNASSLASGTVPVAQLPRMTNNAFGIGEPDGTNITLNGNGQLTATLGGGSGTVTNAAPDAAGVLASWAGHGTAVLTPTFNAVVQTLSSNNGGGLTNYQETNLIVTVRLSTNGTTLTLNDDTLICFGTNQLVTNGLTTSGKRITVRSDNVAGSVIITNTGTVFHVPGLGLTTNAVYLGGANSASNEWTGVYANTNW